jgi:arylsulfatase A-like enzyme
VEEIDWSVGEILDSLKRHGLEDRTIVMFTSDNGPWYQGSAGGLRGRKGQSWEGGQRVPLIVRWPGRIAPGEVCDQPAMNIDVLPTLLDVAGLTLPTDRIIDGESIEPLLMSPETPAPDRPLFFYHIGELEGVRRGEWKYVREISHYTWPMPVNKRLGEASEHTTVAMPLLFNLERDPDESYNLINKYPTVGDALADAINRWEEDLEANRLGLIQ